LSRSTDTAKSVLVPEQFAELLETNPDEAQKLLFQGAVPKSKFSSVGKRRSVKLQMAVVTKPIRYQGKGYALGDACGLEEPWRAILRREPCSYCSDAGGTLDHIVPRMGARKSSGSLDNLASACEECNSRKGHTPLLLYLLSRLSPGYGEEVAA
jgi:hypothetical protein